jgi:DNA modification methylase
VGVPPVTVSQMQCCLGLEPDPTSFVAHLRLVFSELRRVLADHGTLWLNLGDSYAGSWGNQGHTLERSDFHTKYRDADALPARTRTGSRCPDGPGPKNLYGIPWRTAFALQEDGWTLRNAITWTKPNSMPESVHDRLASRCEMVFLFTKQPRYSFDLDAIRQPPRRPQTLDEGVVSRAATPAPGRGRRVHTQHPEARPPRSNPQTNCGPTGSGHTNTHPNGRNPGDFWDVDTDCADDALPDSFAWSIPTQPFPEAHVAVMPVKLAERCVRAGCKPAGTVLDPFSGSGTTGLAASRLGRKYLGVDLNREYLDLSLRTRLHAATLDFGEVS